MRRSDSRIPPPPVKPVRRDGIRYEQVLNGFQAGFDQMGGYLAAFDQNTGAVLWMLKIYDNPRDPRKEGDVQDVFFRSMRFAADGTLAIENERGERFRVDPVSRTVAVES